MGGMIHSLILFGALSFLASCATAPKEQVTPQIEEQAPEVKRKPFTVATTRGYTPTESEIKSLEVFNEIYRLVKSSRKEKTVLPEIEKLYLEIITQYPDAPLARESYWRLTELYIHDYSPPAFQKAETLYQEFSGKYPRSSYKGRIQEVIGKAYYKKSDWDNLLRLCTPEVNTYRETGQKPIPSVMYMYSEANFHLGNIEKAIEGYRVVVKLYSRTIEGRKASIKLKEIEEKRESNSS
jgi:tetratricopeptide (TPR) repeat protein